MPEELLAELTIGDHEFLNNERIQTGRLRVLANSTWQVRHGCQVYIECQVLTLDGSLTLDVRGENGVDGINGSPDRPGWLSGPPEDHRAACWNWWLAVNTENKSEEGVDATPGTDGGDGGMLTIRYVKTGTGTDLGSIKDPLTSGGMPGKPAYGSKGQLMVCGAPYHPHLKGHVRQRPNGRDWYGQPGRPGEVVIERITSVVAWPS